MLLLPLLLWLLWTVMLPGRAQAQSGEPDTDMAPTVSCTSHISLYEGSSISCQLISRSYDLNDDDDEDEDAIEKMTACCCELGQNNKRCVDVLGETLSSKDLNPISDITLTVLSKRGHRIEKTLDLKKIIKPKSPQVQNITLNQDQALVRVQIPYHNDYLKEKNVYFQLQLWNDETNQTQNMTSGSMNIGLDHLRHGSPYHVKVRAIPWLDFQGTWSEWSLPFTFHTPQTPPGKNRGETSGNFSETLWSFIIPVVLVVIVSVVLMWKNKLQTYMWPNIPKSTLEKICGPNNGPLLFCVPEEFSALNVSTSVSQSARPSCTDTESTLSSAGTNESPSCSTQSTDVSMSTSSAGTEELELLSHCSTSEEEHEVPSASLAIENSDLHIETPPTEHNTAQHEKDHSYVTMSSFYQIKPARTADRTVPINLICSN